MVKILSNNQLRNFYTEKSFLTDSGGINFKDRLILLMFILS